MYICTDIHASCSFFRDKTLRRQQEFFFGNEKKKNKETGAIELKRKFTKNYFKEIFIVELCL